SHPAPRIGAMEHTRAGRHRAPHGRAGCPGAGGATAGGSSCGRGAMLTGVRELGIAALPWNREARDLQARIEFVRAALGGAQGAPAAWPEVSDAALGATLESWLTPWLDGVTRREHLARVPLTDALRARLTFEQRRELEEWAPANLTMPSGSRIRVDYLDDSAPAVSVRLQEVFGLAD